MSDTTAYKRARDLPLVHLLEPGTPMCAGCGGLGLVRQIHDVLGENTVVVNAAGCMTLLAVYPHTPFHGSWLYTSMASAAAGAQGVRDALDIQLATGKLAPHDDLQVVVLAGDGSSNGMGLSATSAAIDRGLDFLYVCYDNEGFGNTGQQTSGATPHGARTSTDPAGFAGEKKDLFAIWAAHSPSYLATVAACEPLDLARKIERARQIRGPKLVIGFAPCPPGWDYEPEDSMRIEKLAIDSGIFPLKELIEGSVVHTKRPNPRLPVESYLETQGRFRHLFEPKRDVETLAHIQARVDAYWARQTR